LASFHQRAFCNGRCRLIRLHERHAIHIVIQRKAIFQFNICRLRRTDYTTLGDAEQNVVMIKAKQLTKEKIKNSMAGGDMKYSFGAVSVDKTGGL